MADRETNTWDHCDNPGYSKRMTSGLRCALRCFGLRMVRREAWLQDASRHAGFRARFGTVRMPARTASLFPNNRPTTRSTACSGIRLSSPVFRPRPINDAATPTAEQGSGRSTSLSAESSPQTLQTQSLRDLAGNSTRAIPLVPLHPHFLVERQPRQICLGPAAECLYFLGCVDRHWPDLVLLFLGVENGNRVAVRDTDDKSDQNVVGVGREA